MHAYLAGALTFDAAFAAFVRATRRLAKRQMTWFRAERTTCWFHPERDRAAVLTRAEAWLDPSCPRPTSISSALSPR
jgi:tRNA A37 N6-isopentenylltransferase MiaA